MLDKDVVCVPEFAAENDLRRRKSLEMHKAEQRRHALHHLGLQSLRRPPGAVPTAWGETSLSSGVGGAGDADAPHHSPRSRQAEGIKDLLRQLQQAAPSHLIPDVDVSAGIMPPADLPPPLEMPRSTRESAKGMKSNVVGGMRRGGGSAGGSRWR